jgi:uncharacterized membrane protein YjjP (DUF1212 family)
MSEEIKGYKVQKNINPPAKIIGLYFNTFFVFILSSAILVMIGSNTGGIIGTLSAVAISGLVYIFLFALQTKFGPKKIAKIVNNFLTPFNHIKINKSIKRSF